MAWFAGYRAYSDGGSDVQRRIYWREGNGYPSDLRDAEWGGWSQ